MKALNQSLRRSISLLIVILIITAGAKAQLKVGDNPTTVNKSSILELESTRQGLLLPRLTDTAAINLLTPPDGMIIFLTTDKSLRLRSNGGWKKIADLAAASANWSLSGNAGTNPSTQFLGTTDGQPLVMRTANNERMRIDASGNIGIGTASPSAKLHVDGTVKLQNLGAGTTELEVLVLAADGSVHKRTMASTAFENAIKAINGIQKQTLSITADASTTADSVKVENRASDSTIAIHLPIQDGASGATKPYGMLTYADWQKISSGIQTLTIGVVASSSNVNGASINTTGTSREIILHPADATNAGIVTAGAQTFGGNKTFNNNIIANGTVKLNNVTSNTTSDSVLVVNNGVIEKRKVSSSTFGKSIQNINGNRDSVQKIAFRNSGTDLTVSTNGTDSIYLNVPDASTTARGVINTGAQTIGGHKTFQDSLTATKTMVVGKTGNANSTVEIGGSLAMAIRTITASTTVTATDNTILANTTSAAITITLPNPSTFPGRIYTIKKIGSGGLDKELTITPASGTIDGGSTYIIYNDWTYVTMQTDGTDWFIIKK